MTLTFGLAAVSCISDLLDQGASSDQKYKTILSGNHPTWIAASETIQIVSARLLLTNEESHTGQGEVSVRRGCWID